MEIQSLFLKSVQIKKINNIIRGGLANIFKNDIKPKPIVKPNLTLEGLQVIGSLYYAEKKF